MIRTAARGLRRSLAHLAERCARGPVILLYHRIARQDSDPFGLCVSPANFARHLEVLAGEHEPLPLAELAARVASGRATRREVAITFDDGYRDNLEAALPLLERYRIPATFFIASDALGSSSGFWWDILERAVLRNASLPRQIEVPVGTAFARFAAPGPWDAAGRTKVFRTLHDQLVELPPAARQAAMASIVEVCGGGGAATPPVMTPGEVRTLAAHAGMEIGAHSRSHSMLTRLDEAVKRMEIRESRRDLEALAGRPVRAFAYPYGYFDDATVAAARAEGMEQACTCVPRRVAAGDDALRLPRLEVPDCDGESFSRSLAWSMPRAHPATA